MAASRINATNCLIGAKTKITITRDSALYRHTLSWTCGNLSGTFVTKTLLQNYSATIPESIYSLIPNRQTATVTIRCDTFNGSTNIGYDTINITVTADASKCKPVITYSSLIDANTDTVAFSGSNLKCVANESRMTVSGVSTRFPISGDTATIVSLKLRCGAKEANIVNGSAFIAKAPSGNMRLVAVDSRDFETSLPLNAETIYYEKPVIYGKFYRPVPTEDTIKVDYSGNLYYQTGIQTNLLKVEYGTPNSQVAGGWEWVEIALPTVTVPPGPQTTGYAKDNITLGSSFPYRDGFRFKLRVSDGLYKEIESEEYYVNRGTPIFDWGDTDFNFNVDINFDNKEQTEERRIWFSGTGTHSHSATLYGGNPNSNTAIGLYDNGNGHGILQYRDTDNRIIFGNGDTSLYLGNQLMDFVVGSGTSDTGEGTWYYHKWASGKLEAWGRFTFANPNWTAWGAQYTAEYDLIYLGLNLVSTPYVFVTTSGGVYGSVVGVKGATSALCTVALARPNTTTSTMYLNCQLVGRWK